MDDNILQFPKKRKRRASDRPSARIYDQNMVMGYARLHPNTKSGLTKLAEGQGMTFSEFLRKLAEVAVEEQWQYIPSTEKKNEVSK